MLVLLGALLAVTGPNAASPRDVCLMEESCRREAVFCLLDEPRCATPPHVCLVDGCPGVEPHFPRVESRPRNR